MIQASRSHGKYVVLVVDPHTSKIISSCSRMYDIMEAGVLVLQNLLLDRERLELPAVYFVSPTVESVKRIMNDFAGSKTQYETAYLYFTSAVPNDVWNMFKSSKLAQSKGRLKCFKELNVDFIANESRVFTLGRPNAIPRLFFPSRTEHVDELKAQAKQLVALLLTMKELPYIRYAKSKKNNSLCQTLAEIVESEMKSAVSNLRDWNYEEPRATLLIVDRSLDPNAPLMHEYTYQAMVNDLLPVDGELCLLPYEGKDVDAAVTFDAKATREQQAKARADAEEKVRLDNTVVLSEDDSLWLEYRHQHIAAVMQDVSQRFREFKGQNKMAQLQSGNGDSKSNTSLKDLLQAMKAMPNYKTMMRQFHKHMSVAAECMNQFTRMNLSDIGEMEQDMATGVSENGQVVEMKKIKNKLVEMCQSPHVSVLDKLRLVMIYIISQGGIQEVTRNTMMRTIDMKLQQAILNLAKLGVDLATTGSSHKAKHSKAQLDEYAKHRETISLALMRYVPVLYSVMSDLAKGQLDDGAYPYTRPPPPDMLAGSGSRAASGSVGGTSARRKGNAPSNWRQSGREEKNEDNGKQKPRFLVFVIGGVTFSEMRSAYQVSRETNTQVFIGSSSTLSCSDYVQSLSGLEPDEFQRRIGTAPGIVVNAGGSAGASSGSSGAAYQGGRSERRRNSFDSEDDESDDEDRISIRMDRL